MYRLAAQSVRARLSSFTACALAVFLGGTLILAFLTLFTTATAHGTSHDDQSALITMASVVGGWGFLIVIFAVVSTMQLAVRQRSEEFALLRTVGSTPKQIRRVVFGESLFVAGLASIAALLPGWLGGRALVALLRNADVVSDKVRYHAGIAPMVGTIVLMLLATVCAARFAARPALAGSASASLRASRTGATTMSRKRKWLGVGLLGLGLNYAILALTSKADGPKIDDKFATMQFAGPAVIFTSIGVAVFAPVLLRFAANLAAGMLRQSPTGQLAAIAIRERAFDLSSVLMPVIALVGISTGTLYMVSIDADNQLLKGHNTQVASTETLNLVVVGMICVFAAIMVINALAASIAARRREFGLQRLAGSTKGQVLSMTRTEATLVAITGVVVGGVASLAAVIPYTVVKTPDLVPTTRPWLFPVVAVLAAVITVLTTGVATRRVVRTPAVESVAA